LTGTELKQLSENILDNNVSWDTDFFYQLLNIAKTKLESKRLWQFLKKLDSSNSASSSLITLPTDFAEEYKILVGTTVEYFPVPFEEQHIYKNSPNRYFLDMANLTLKLLGSNIQSNTLYIYYKRFTDDINATTSPVFPVRFHPLLAFYVSAFYQVGIDSDDIFARMSPANRQMAMELEQALERWDANLAMRSQNNQIGVANSNPSIAIGNM
jgi:hypothetical protein